VQSPMRNLSYSALGPMFKPKRTGHHNLAQLFRALSYPARLRIVESLAQEETRVCHLATLLGRPQPCVSQRLAILRAAGLAINEKVVSSGWPPSRPRLIR
jgi:DNA-binding transcriptional ArsR family regulator